jgi:hypothetical protein
MNDTLWIVRRGARFGALLLAVGLAIAACMFSPTGVVLAT